MSSVDERRHKLKFIDAMNIDAILPLKYNVFKKKFWPASADKLLSFFYLLIAIVNISVNIIAVMVSIIAKLLNVISVY